MESNKLNALIEKLNTLGHGSIPEADRNEVLIQLSNCWAGYREVVTKTLLQKN